MTKQPNARPEIGKPCVYLHFAERGREKRIHRSEFHGSGARINLGVTRFVNRPYSDKHHAYHR